MPTETGAELIEYAQNQVGDALRTVAILYEEGFEVVYLRDDLSKNYDPTQYKEIAASFRIDLKEDLHQSSESLIGEKISTIHYHENAYVFQFLHEDCHSLLLSVEPDVGERLQYFIEGCEDRI
jgi:hypothetical protein